MPKSCGAAKHLAGRAPHPKSRGFRLEESHVPKGGNPAQHTITHVASRYRADHASFKLNGG
jgi:hypothetical protein